MNTNQQTRKARLAEQKIIITGDLDEALRNLNRQFKPLKKKVSKRLLAKIVRKKNGKA